MMDYLQFLTYIASVYASNYYPDPAQVCDGVEPSWMYPQGELSCRRNLAGGLQCRDITKCATEGMHCSESDIAVRAGNVCPGSFFSYNGGWPLSKLTWSTEREFYECIPNATHEQVGDYCPHWLTIESSWNEWEAGDAQCRMTGTSNGRTYCKRWTIEQIEVEICKERTEYMGYSGWDSNYLYGGHGFSWNPWLDAELYNGGSWLDEKFSAGWETYYSGPWNRFPYQCWCWREGDEDSPGYWELCGPEVEFETAECECTHNNMHGVCDDWSCIERGIPGSAPEYEKYAATKLHEDGAIEAWSGSIDSEEEFEFSECICKETSANNHYCKRWECMESGQSYFFPNLLWCLLHIPIKLAFAACLAIGAEDMEDGCMLVYGPCAVILWLSWDILFVWLGGVGELVIIYSIFLTPLWFLFLSKIKSKVFFFF